MSCPLPVPKELERFKGDMIAILPGLEALTQRIEECKQVILKWGEEGENYGGGRKRAKNVSTGLCQGSIKIEFVFFFLFFLFPFPFFSFFVYLFFIGLWNVVCGLRRPYKI